MKRIFKITLALTASLIAFQSWADDIEVYVNGTFSAQKPNVVFILDNSHYMNEKTDSADSTFNRIFGFSVANKPQRMQVVKGAIKQLIDEGAMDDINLTLMPLNPNLGYYKNDSNICVELATTDICFRGGFIANAMKAVKGNESSFKSLLDSNEFSSDRKPNYSIGTKYRRNAPIVEATHEAFNYLSGAKVDYGMRKLPKKSIAGLYRSTASAFKGLDYYSPLSTTDSFTSTTYNSDTRYKKPLAQQCQKSHIVLFTSGLSSADSESDGMIKALISNIDKPEEFASKLSASCSTNSSIMGEVDWGNVFSFFGTSSSYKATTSCLEELAYYMYHKDKRHNSSDVPSEYISAPSVQFHAIAGFVSDELRMAKQILDTAADLGGTGSSHLTRDYESVKNAIKTVFDNIIQGSQTMASPVVPIEDLGSFQFSNEVYYSLFEANKGPVWKGNVKRYRASLDGIVDVKGEKALDDDGFFKKTAHSYWSAEADGDRVTEGGFASILPATRNVKTNGNAKVVGGDDGDDFAAWLKSGAHKTLGDFLHTNPTVVNYKDHGRVLFVGSNSGYLHAIKTDKDNPTELSAFVPKELLPIAKQYFLGQADDINTSKLYGLDGPINFWHDDTNSNSIVDNNEKVYLYVGMRRGGNTYYAFDVSNPSDIELKWQFDVPGQSWSKVRPINIKWEEDGQETYKTVLVVAGGYDATKEDHFEVKPSSSNGGVIYILDPLATNDAQRVLWSSANNTADIRDGDQMNRSIIGDIYLVDNDSDYTNLLYIADIAGRIWRFDLDFGKKTPSSNNSELLVVGAMIADLSNGTERFYNSLEVTKRKRSFEYEVNDDGLKVNNSPRYILALGSGNRAFPNSDESAGKFYIVFDNHTSKVSHKDNYPSVIKREHLSEMSLANDSSSVKNLYPNADDSLGYAFTLKYATAGEKVLNKARIDNNLVIFNTYRKALVPFNEETCEPNLGDSMLYVVDLRNGTHESRVINVPGLPSPPTPFSDGGPEIHDPNADGRNDPDNENFDFEIEFLYWKETAQ